jgi:hypothetical protein
MVFGGGGPPPPINDDPRAVRRALEQDRRNSVGITQDAAIITGWIWRALTCPIRLVISAIRGRRHDDDIDGL